MTQALRVLYAGREFGFNERIDLALSLLPRAEFTLTRVAGIEAAAAQARGGNFDACVLDLHLPGAHGLEGFLRITSECETVPIVCLTTPAGDAPAVEAMRRGAQEFLYVDALTASGLAHSLRQAVERWRFILTLQRQATYDEMTGLRNRHGFMRLAQYRFSLARRARAALALLFLDIDGLKFVNDTYGHREGDALIADTAGILKSTLRDSDIIGRIGGDEFCVVLGEDNNASTDLVVKRLRRAVERFNASSGRSYAVSLSIGEDRADFGSDGSILTLEELIHRADAAMYEAKRERRAARLA